MTEETHVSKTIGNRVTELRKKIDDLDGFDLSGDAGLGISNVFIAHEVDISGVEGTVVSIQSLGYC